MGGILSQLEHQFNCWARNPLALNLGAALALIFFFALVFIPPVFLFTQATALRLDAAVINAIGISFAIALIVLVADLMFGVPLAWLLAAKQFPGKSLLDGLIDMPLIVPTSALGFSVGLFWGSAGLGLLDKGFWLIVMLHIAFTLPYITRTLHAAILEIRPTCFIAGRTLGASPLLAFRTISVPLFRDSLLTGALLAVARSLSETGATMVVAGGTMTATVLALGYKNNGDIGGAISVSIVLTVISVLLLALVKYFGKKGAGKLGAVNPKLEAYFSNREFSWCLGWGFLAIFALALLWAGLKYLALSPFTVSAFLFFSWAAISLAAIISLGKRSKLHWVFLGSTLIFLIFVFLPSFFFLGALDPGRGADYSLLIESLLISFAIAGGVTVINLIFGVPLALLIVRRPAWRFLDSLLDIVIVIPTVALGLSLAMFWGKADAVLVVALAHLSFTFPYVVKPVLVAAENLNPNLEGAAASLGAKPVQIFRTITLPLIAPSILAGAVLAFMRSLSETGATLAISSKVNTIPVLIVNLVKADKISEAALACLALLIVSLVVVMLLRRSEHREGQGQ